MLLVKLERDQKRMRSLTEIQSVSFKPLRTHLEYSMQIADRTLVIDVIFQLEVPVSSGTWGAIPFRTPLACFATFSEADIFVERQSPRL